MKKEKLAFSKKVYMDEANAFKDMFLGSPRKCTYDEFCALHDPSIKPTGAIHVDSQGFDLVLNNIYELQLAKRLASSGYALSIHGQTHKIPYVKPWAKNPSPYYPDFIIYTREGHIAFLEMKSIMGMAQDETIAKYRYLAGYCLRHGYLYAMVDVDCIGFEEYFWPYFDQKLDDYFTKTVAATGGFNEQALNEYLHHVPKRKHNEVKRRFAALILLSPYLCNRYCHDDPKLVNAVRLPYPLPYKDFKKKG